MRKSYIPSYSLLLTLITAIIMSACGSIAVTPRVLFLTDTHEDKTARIVEGGRVHVDLLGKPDSGNRWQIVSGDNSLLQQLGDPKVRHYTDSMGSGDTTQYVFRALKPGETTLKFEFRNKDSGQVNDTYEVTIEVVANEDKDKDEDDSEGKDRSWLFF